MFVVATEAVETKIYRALVLAKTNWSSVVRVLR